MTNKPLMGVSMSIILSEIPKLGVYETVRKCAEIGYPSIEVSRIPMNPENIAALNRVRDEYGMKIAGCSANISTDLGNTAPGEHLNDPDGYKRIVQACKEVDCNILRVGMLPFGCLGSYEKAYAFTLQMNDMAKKLKDDGIDLYYQHHAFEFVRYNGQYFLDIMRDNAPDLGFELDIHWIHVGGENPVKFIESYKDRIRLLHLKDYRIGEYVFPKVEKQSDFLKAFGDSMYTIIQSAEIGVGSLPVKECIEAGLANGAEFFLVEQDLTYGRDPFDCLKNSRDNLIKMGYGEWFKP